MKPTQNENEHVWETERKRRLKNHELEQQATAEAEKVRLKDLHWMHCPKCGLRLAAEQNGKVEIDVCPSCRGVWLDANELETIVATESSFLRSCLKILR